MVKRKGNATIMESPASTPSVSKSKSSASGGATSPSEISPSNLKRYLIMLFPPLLISILWKSTAILTGGALLFKAISLATSGSLSPVILTLNGPVQGRLAHSRNGSAYYQYLSIPYAEAPVGALRFQPPVPVKSWKNVKPGLQYPTACLQFEPLALVRTWGSEDCLFLNVFVPKNAVPTLSKTSGGLPVIVYIHGGAFLEGQSSFYKPDFIMDHQVLVVTINYRLGPLGFLNFQEVNDSGGRYPRGNMGLKDQNMALIWVNKNIAKFGGDPSKVTLMGDSAGAASVNLQMLSPLSKGLFQKAITFSGSSLVPWGFTKYPRRIAFKYGSRLECPINDSQVLLECYLNMDADKMVSLQYSWSDPVHEKDEFVPSVEIQRSKDAFLMKTPTELLENGEIPSNVPLLTGVTSGEGGLRSARFRAYPELIPILDLNFDNLVDRVMFFDDPVPPVMANKLREFYFGNQSFSENQRHFLSGMTKLASDALFVGPVHKTAIHHSKSGAPTYLFYYDYRSSGMASTFSAFSHVRLDDNNLMKYLKLTSGLAWDWVMDIVFGDRGPQQFGVGHAENVFQIWNAIGVTKWLTLGDVEFSKDLVKSIVDFANDSEPLTFRGKPWPKINDFVRSKSEDDLPFMKLDNGGGAEVVKDPFKERMQLWKTLRSKYSTI